MKSFVWKHFEEDAHMSNWNGMLLGASEDGSWWAADPNDYSIGSIEQVAGSNLLEAKRRAQAAAMVLYDLWLGWKKVHDQC